MRYRGQALELDRARAAAATRELREAFAARTRSATATATRRRGRARHGPRHRRDRRPRRSTSARPPASDGARARRSSSCPRRRSSSPTAGAATTDADRRRYVLERCDDAARPDRPAGQPAPCAPRARRWAPCSCAPPTRPTSRSAATARPRCSTPTARWSCRPSTSPSTSARCPPPSRPCAAGTTRPARRGSSTTPTRAAPTCPTSRSSRRCSHDGELLGFAASRAHHADVGGRVPGSMPADSTTLDEEGVVIAPRVLDDATRSTSSSRQMRQPAQRRADLRAQLAANRAGAARLTELAERIGARAACARRSPRVLDYAERRTRACLADADGRRRATRRRRARGASTATSSCALAATVDGDALTLDFTGSAAQHDGNLNCPLAVTRSACLFAVRVLTDPDIPPSAGAYRPITVIAPEGSLLNARPPAAVAAGNVETSSRVADLVLARVRPRARPGHDEQPHARQRRLYLLRDARRRPGRVPGRRRPQRRARRDVATPSTRRSRRSSSSSRCA